MSWWLAEQSVGSLVVRELKCVVLGFRTCFRVFTKGHVGWLANILSGALTTHVKPAGSTSQTRRLRVRP